MEITINEGLIGGKDVKGYKNLYSNRLEKGDKLVLYVSGDKKIKGAATVVGEYFYDEEEVWPPKKGEVWPHRREIRVDFVYERGEEPDVRQYYSRLKMLEEAREEEKKLGKSFGRTISGLTPTNISQFDYRLLTGKREVSYFILQTGSEEYADRPKRKYHFKEGIPGSRQLREADVVKFIYYEDRKFYATGEIKEIEPEEKEEVQYFYGLVENYEELPKTVPLEDVQGKLHKDYPTQYGITKIERHDYDVILDAAQSSPPTEKVPARLYAPLDIELEDLFEGVEALIFPTKEGERLKDEIAAALNAGQHILFFGPPGTGKTELARLVCERVAKKIDSIDDFLMTTATADWTTFNTIGGYMPSERGERLQFTPGQFLRCFRSGPRQRRLVNKWLLIDELNRADIDKAFGQLFTVLSGQSIELPFVYPTKGREEQLVTIQPLTPIGDDMERLDLQEHCYYVPVSWRILATINTYDKASLYEMSYAFMRRFAFIQVRAPKAEEIDDLMDAYLGAWGLQETISPEHTEAVKNLWKTINKTPETGVPRRIGPAIIKDLLHYLREGGSLVQGLIAYVLPQFEGIRERARKVDQLLSFFEAKGEEKAKEQLQHAAIDLLQIPREQLEGE